MASERTTGRSWADRLRGNRWLPWLLLLAWMALIYQLSATPDLKAVPWAQRFGLLPKLLGREATDLLEFVLRKSAHMGAYAILALLARWAFSGTWPTWTRGRLLAAALGFAVLFAASDEYHQTLVPTRVGSLRDVAIDAAGAVAALLLPPWWRLRK